MKKRKGRNVRKQLEDKDSYSSLGTKPTITLDTGEVVSEREWKRRFDDDWYNATRNGDFEIIKSVEGQAEARRNNNRRNRDALSVAEKSGTLNELTENEADFMDDVSDDWDWKSAFKQAGPEGAKIVIFDQAKRDLRKGNIDKALSNFYIKMSDLKALMRRTNRKDR